jgi:eukaryotic-like serine/threonine-protein kinase
MTPERWERVCEILEKTLSLHGPDRELYLAEACANDSDLRREVESLLASHDKAGTRFLNVDPLSADGLQGEVRPVSVRVGRRIGPYLVVEEIGRGGMGEVYAAVRADGQYEKRVALKLVRSGYDTRSVIDRFHNERQILAGLDHPNIARLLDGGTTVDGVPYLVMELVQGAPVDSYCDAHKLFVTDRLKLFLQVCSAVQYAHQHLVIHRDIKPSNILVTEEGTPKLLDFGIAKLLDASGSTEATILRPMTPEFASPEQVRGEPITTATDVYSLGVVLYQLLTGRSPYRVKAHTPEKLAQAITNDEPERPSTSVHRVTSETGQGAAVPELSPEAVSNTREASPLRLERRLRGDLDYILLKALRKEPEKRYSSIEQFAEDIRRHLERLPVTARKGTWSYRSGKFIRRNRIGVSAAALVLLTLAGGMAVSWHEARIADANRKRAEKRFNDVRKLANSLIFEIHDSIQGLPGATPSRKLLLDRALEYLNALSQEAGDDVDLQRELAWGYQRLATVQGDSTQSNLGQVSDAAASNRKALALFESLAKANPHNVTDQLNLAMAYRTRALFDVYIPRGRSEIDQAIAVTDRLMQTDGNRVEVRNERAQEYLVLSYIQDAVGDRLQAIETYRKVRDLREDILRTNPDYPGARQGLPKVTILLAHEIGRFGARDEAISLMNTGIASYEALVTETGRDPGVIRELATAEGRRGDVELINGDIAAARSDFRRSRERIERLARLDPENKMLQSDLWVADYHEGRALAASGRYAEALTVLRHAFKGYEDLHLEADVGPGPAAMEAWIGEAQAGVHDWAGALKSFEHAAARLAEDQASYDDARCDLAMVETKIAHMLLKAGKLREAATEYNKALSTANLSFSLQHKDIPALYAAAEAYAGMGDIAAVKARKARDTAVRSRLFDQARAVYEESLNTWKQVPHPSKISGNGYAVAAEPKDVTSRLAKLSSLLGTRGPSSL